MLQINASIARCQNRIWCAFRSQHLYGYNSYCYIAELDYDINPLNIKPLTAANGNTAFEDIRLFEFGTELFAFYTYFPKNHSGGWDWVHAMGFGKVDTERGIILNQLSLRGHSVREQEKNWVPYVYESQLYLIADLDPYLRILKLGKMNEPKTFMNYYISLSKTMGWEYGELRGGTPLLSKPGAEAHIFYGFAHSSIDDYAGYNRYYFFTIIKFDHLSKSLEYHPTPLHYKSEPEDEEFMRLWKLSTNGTRKIIFPMGLMHHRDGLLVSFGIDDVYSSTEYYSWDNISKYFR